LVFPRRCLLSERLALSDPTLRQELPMAAISPLRRRMIAA
jgi:hypothetical protein